MRNLLRNKNLIVVACSLVFTGVALAYMNRPKTEEQVYDGYEVINVSDEPVVEA